MKNLLQYLQRNTLTLLMWRGTNESRYNAASTTTVTNMQERDGWVLEDHTHIHEHTHTHTCQQTQTQSCILTPGGRRGLRGQHTRGGTWAEGVPGWLMWRHCKYIHTLIPLTQLYHTYTTHLHHWLIPHTYITHQTCQTCMLTWRKNVWNSLSRKKASLSQKNK